MELNKKNPDQWVSNLEQLNISMNTFWSKGSNGDKNFMIDIIYNLPKEYDVNLDNPRTISNQVALLHWQPNNKIES